MNAVTTADAGAAGLGAAGPLQVQADRGFRAKHGRTTIVWAWRVGLLVALVAVWQVLSGPVLDPQYVSSPQGIWERLAGWTADGTLWTNTWITIQEIVLGFLLGAGAGAVLAYLIAPIRVVWAILDPYVMALYAIPKVALAPLFIVWFGIGTDMKVLLAAVSVFFLVFINTAAGVHQVDSALIDAVRLMNGSRRDIALKVVLPASMTGLLTGLRVSIPYALIGAVIGELVASNRGLGFLISDSSAKFDTDGVFATLLVLSIIAMVLNGLVGLIDARTSRWKPLDA
ncbi:ABC transporter permease [Myceligenerans pegani]|uniref:ABC transporter permease n=1 Tax=Myceligenerans pegani TaxID=2776917 RepID=A0ABR9N6X8_9MICO|nr:ABC transporter permease [Myceligenerans sp. TRM 65318]MBE1879041.1 ABC transporter permease [Myceligenerans sp. TRM 65318]MBE3021312.1 ABC transporter permease [Myceligenerans sp. TRM 65318]